MFNSVQYVRDVCSEKKIAVSKLERELGFSNGYLNPKKMSAIPYERAVVIANYLNIPVVDIFGGENENPLEAPKRSEGEEKVLSLFNNIPEELRDEAIRYWEFLAEKAKTP